MIIGILQEDFKFGEVDRNYEIAEEAIQRAAAAGADTVILPEMWTTYFSKENMEEKSDDRATRTRGFLSSLSRDLKVNIIGGSIAEKDGDQYYNSSLVFNKEGEELAYFRKAHLYKIAGEDKYFAPGEDISTFELDGLACGVCICHDISFPEWIRMYALAGVDILFIPTGWPEDGIENWLSLAKARAIENQIYIICADSCGQGSFKFGGKSIAVGPDGKTLALLGDKPTLVLIDIDTESLGQESQRHRLLDERRSEIYKL